MHYSPPIHSTWASPGRPRRSFFRQAAFSLLACFAAAASVQASIYVQQLKLDSLCKNAHRIIRGKVESVTYGQVTAGGGSLPTITYRIKVSETIAGVPSEVVNLTMVTEPKTPIQKGNARRLPILELPTLKEGQEYLLFTTKPSKLGLTSPVGLAQGCFQINKDGNRETALNGVNNAGLGIGKEGPIAYAELAERVRALRPN